MTRFSDAAAGALTALTLPRWMRGDALAALLADPPVRDGTRGEEPGGVEAGLALLRLLARLRLGLWKNTCLYRSVLRCVLMRRAGIPAVVRIGAAAGAEGQGGAARPALHAWVEVVGEPAPAEASGYARLRAGALAE